MFAHSASATAEVLEATGACPAPRWAKLSPNVTDVTEIAAAAMGAGAEALTLINTVMGMAIDVKSRRPVIVNVQGGLSGPAIKPIALRMVHEVWKAVRIPVIGMGGIASGDDARDFLAVGAKCVAVGTESFRDPLAAERIRLQLEEALEKRPRPEVEVQMNLP